MKVNQNPSPTTTSIEKTNSPLKRDSVAKSTPHEAGALTNRSGASIDISDTARLMKQASDLAHAAPDSRLDKITDLKRRISEGTYNIDAGKIADKLVEEHLQTDFGKNSL